ncbi:TPA: phage tail tape measure protein [Serratia marcescens]
MSDRKLQLQVLFNMVDKLSAPLKHLQAGNKKLAAATSETRKQIKQLEEQAGKIDSFNKLRDSVSQGSAKLKESARELRNVRRAYQEAKEPSQKLTAELGRQTRAHQKLLKAQRDELSKLSQVRNELHSNNIDTKALAHSQELLSQKTKLANDAMARQESQLKRNGEMQRQYQKVKEVRNNLAIKGAGMVAIGGGMAATFAPAIHAATEYQNEMVKFQSMNVGDAVLRQSEQLARGMNIQGSSITDNIRVIKDAYSILRNQKEAFEVAPLIAQMQVSSKILEGKGGMKHEDAEESERESQALIKTAELKLGDRISDPKAVKEFINKAFQAKAAAGGLVKFSDYLDLISKGKMAAKNMDDDAFLFGSLHYLQQWGGNALGTKLTSLNNGLWGGHETKSVIDEQMKIGMLRQNAVHYSTTGKIKSVDQGALLKADYFQSNPYQYLTDVVIPLIKKKMPNLDEKGIQNEVAKLFSNTNAQDLYVTHFRETLNYAKQVKAGKTSQTMDQVANSNKNTAVGQQLSLSAEKANLNKQIGDDLMPAYVFALGEFAKALHWVNTEMKNHPKIGKSLIEGIAGVGALSASLGGLALVLAGIISPFATLRYMWGMFTGGRKSAKDIRLLKATLEELNGAGGKAAKKPGLIIRVIKKLIGWAGKLPKVIKVIKEVVAVLARSAWVGAASKIARAARILSSAFKIVRIAVTLFGESLWALMANPIILAITILIVALGIAVYEMWKHWDKVKPWLIKFWNEVCGAASAAWDYLKQKWDGMVDWFEALPAKFKAFGSNIINGLMAGIDEKWQELKAKISKVTDMLPDWMKPSSDENPGSTNAPNAAPRPSISYTPLRTAAAGVPDYGPPAAAPVVIHVHPSPGMNEKALAQHTANALKKHQRQQQASARSKLADMD